MRCGSAIDEGPVSGHGRLRRARRRQGVLRGLRVGRTDPAAAPGLVDRPLADLEDAGPVSGSALSGGDVRRPGQRPVGSSRHRRGLRRRRVRRRRGGGPRRDGDRSGDRDRRLRRRPLGAHARGIAPGAGRRGRVHLSGGPARRDTPGTDGHRVVRRGAGHRRVLGEVQPALLGPRLPGVRRVLHVPAVHRAALHQADRGRGRLGARDDSGDADADAGGAGAPGPGRGPGARRRGPLPVSGDPRAQRPHRVRHEGGGTPRGPRGAVDARRARGRRARSRGPRSRFRSTS